MDSKLVVVVQKLETKVRQLRAEQQELAQRVELAQLDKELAEERVREVEAQLALAGQQQTSQQTSEQDKKSKELEELKQLNAEIEETWAAREEDLLRLVELHRSNHIRAEQEILELQERLNRPIPEVQLNGALTQEIAALKLKLNAAYQDLDAQKRGLFVVLAEHCPEWAPYIKYASSVDPEIRSKSQATWEKFTSGSITSTGLSKELASIWTEFEVPARPDVLSFLELLSELGYNVGNLRDRVVNQHGSLPSDLISSQLTARKFDLDRLAMSIQNRQDATSEIEEKLASAQARINVLEQKLTAARNLASEIKRLESNNLEADRTKKLLQERLKKAEEESSRKLRELEQLKIAQIPNSMETAELQSKFAEMRSTISYLSSLSATSSRCLDDIGTLEVKPGKPGTNFAGNSSMSRIRSAVRDFEIVPITDDRSKARAGVVALQQYAELFRLFITI